MFIDINDKIEKLVIRPVMMNGIAKRPYPDMEAKVYILQEKMDYWSEVTISWYGGQRVHFTRENGLLKRRDHIPIWREAKVYILQEKMDYWSEETISWYGGQSYTSYNRKCILFLYDDSIQYLTMGDVRIWMSFRIIWIRSVFLRIKKLLRIR